ncbi:MAG: hypothetical protein ACI89X_000809 [Planctomycetota bacterium]|jgi:hypothetical protein
MSRTESDRTTALKLLSHFRRRILPGALRRIGSWKAIPRLLLRDWLDDVLQELAVDCLEHAGAIVSMPERERHARWMRQAEKVIYRHRRGLANQQLTVEEPAPSWAPQDDYAVQIPPLVTLNNGRPNVTASVRAAGIARRDLRRQLDVLATRLGWDVEQQSFWQARVAEALTGLAADLLQEQGAVQLLHPTPAPDIDRREARLHRLAGKFPVQPSTQQVRRALRPWIRRRSHEGITPRALLEQAIALQPQSMPAQLWLFEACCNDRDPRGALRALRAARKCQLAPRAAVVLARARVLELRGNVAAAIGLLQRSANRWPRDREIRLALAIATAA